MSSAMLVPSLRFPEFEGEWEDKELGCLFKIGSGRDYKHLSNGNIPVYGTGGYMTSVDNYLYEGESVCIGRKGTIDKPVYLNEKFWTVDTLFYTHSFVSEPKFIYAIFQKINWKKYNEASGVPSLSKATIEKIKVIVPSLLPEQQKIADFLTAVDQRIEQLEEKKRLLTEYKKGVMQQIFSQHIRFTDDNGNSYPDWQEKRLGDVCSVQSSKRVHQKDWTASGVPFYRAREIVKMQKGEALKDPIFISQDKYAEIKSTYPMPVENDILITGVGTIGIPYIIKNNDPFYFKDGNLLWLSNITVDSRWVYHCILEPKTMENIHNEAGSTVQTFTIQQAKALLVPLPCIEEQRKISDLFGTLGDKVSQAAAQIEQAKTFKKGLLQQMFV